MPTKVNPTSGHASGPDDKEAVSPEALAYRWLSRVEEMCRRAFVPDDVIHDRARVKIAARTRPIKTVGVDVPRKAKGQLHVLAVAGAMDTWLARLDAPLTPEEEKRADEQASRGAANRDLLAHRLGRPFPVIRWQGCTTDCYSMGAGAYRRRLAAVGQEMASLGWIDEPASHPWKPKRGAPAFDMEQRMRDADANAAAMVDGGSVIETGGSDRRMSQ